MKTKQLEEALIGAVLNPLTTNRVMEACEKRGVTAAWFARPEAKRVWPILETQWRNHPAASFCPIVCATSTPSTE